MTSGASDFLTSNGRRVPANTVDDYIDALRKSLVFYPVECFDIVGKQTLKTNLKWYMVRSRPVQPASAETQL